MRYLQFFRRMREDRPWIYVAMIFLIFVRDNCVCVKFVHTGTCLHVYLYAFAYVSVAVGVHTNI